MKEPFEAPVTPEPEPEPRVRAPVPRPLVPPPEPLPPPVEPGAALPTQADAPVEEPAPGALAAEGLVAHGAGLAFDPASQAPLHDIAQAFRMNAEALHTLKSMQVELARTVQRGDRSELMLQSTRALNDTFRNVATVQRELLDRLDESKTAGRGPMVPLMILGLLVVVVAGVYVILDEIQKSKETGVPEVNPTEIVDSWKEGRREGERSGEQEIQRLRDSLEEEKSRGRTLQQTLDANRSELSDVDRARRAAELERDDFAGRVRKAQNEVLAKKALEDEIGSLRSMAQNTDREATDLQIALDRRRRENAYLRQKLADYGMDIPDDDPPYRPPERDAPAPSSAKAAAAKKPINLLTAKGAATPKNPVTGGKTTRSRMSDARSGAVPPLRFSGFPPPGEASAPQPQPTEPRDVATAPAPRGALPPPVLRRRGGLEKNRTVTERVRTRLNNLLASTVSPSGRSYVVTRIDGVGADRVGGVMFLRYDSAGRMIDAIEARDMRITVDRESRRVEFEFHEGMQVGQNRRTPLPRQGAKVVVAEGDASGKWSSSGLTMVRTR